MIIMIVLAVLRHTRYGATITANASNPTLHQERPTAT